MNAPPMDVSFAVLDVAPEPYTVSPVLTVRVGVTAGGPAASRPGARDRAALPGPHRAAAPVVLRRRSGRPDGPVRARERWANTQRTFLWQHCTAMVPGIHRQHDATLPLDCTYDFEVAAAKYLHALRDGACRSNSCSAERFSSNSERGFSVQQVPWDREDRYDMPVGVWRDLIAQHYPNSGWMRLSHETIAELAGYKSGRGLLDFDQAITSLLDATADREVTR